MGTSYQSWQRDSRPPVRPANAKSRRRATLIIGIAALMLLIVGGVLRRPSCYNLTTQRRLVGQLLRAAALYGSTRIRRSSRQINSGVISGPRMIHAPNRSNALTGLTVTPSTGDGFGS